MRTAVDNSARSAAATIAARRIVLLLVIIGVALLELTLLFEPRNSMADSFRRAERMAALRDWATEKTPESRLRVDHEKELLTRHESWTLALNLGVFLAIETFLVYQFRRQIIPDNRETQPPG